MAMPEQKPGRSKQDYRTPENFLTAVRRRLGIQQFYRDLAADADNAVCPVFYTKEDDAFQQDWSTGPQPSFRWNWLNPPFAKIEPWVRKAWECQWNSQTALLVPAGVGSNWWRLWVHGRAEVLLLNGRLTFVGETTCYPKDCCLLLYGPDREPTYDVWTWPLEMDQRGDPPGEQPQQPQHCDDDQDHIDQGPDRLGDPERGDEAVGDPVTEAQDDQHDQQRQE